MSPFRAGLLAGVVLTLALLGAAVSIAALTRNPTERRMGILCGAALFTLAILAAICAGITCGGVQL